MAPRGHALPQAATESAREARKSFFCELCQKGYARMNDFEAHEGSYDHQHRKRLKELKQLSKDPNAAAKAQAAERRANEESGLKSLNSPSLNPTAPAAKKKPVFKSTLQPQNAALLPAQELDEELYDPTDLPYERYDPFSPTPCGDNCPRCHARGDSMRL